MANPQVQPKLDLPDLVPSLIEAAREYRWLMHTEGDMARRLKSIARTMSVAGPRTSDTHEPSVGDDAEQGDHLEDDTHLHGVALSRLPRNAHLNAVLAAPALEAARAFIRSHRMASARRVEYFAKQLQIYPWAQEIRGIGALSLGLIIAASGDLSNYATPAKLWKRMGLAVFDGKAQRRITGRADIAKGRTKDEAVAAAIAQGYSPSRRSLMHVVGDTLVKLNDGEYRALYDSRKAYEQEKHPDLRPIQHHKRALRYMEKRFLLNLWREWQSPAAPLNIDRRTVRTIFAALNGSQPVEELQIL